MADRYWVGTTGNWSSTANWSATSGGASGASVPTSADNVIFDKVATYTVTFPGTASCLDFTVSAGTVTFTSSGNSTVSIYGSFSIVAATSFSLPTFTIALTFRATTTGKTITTNGVTIPCDIVFNGSGGAWTLGGALTQSGSFSPDMTFSNGTFNSGNFNITTTNMGGTSNGTVNLGSSTVTISSAIAFSSFNSTLNAGTSSIVCNNAAAVLYSIGSNFYNVTLSGASPDVQANTFNTLSFTNTDFIANITGAVTCVNLSVSARTAVGVSRLTLAANVTVSGTLTVSGNANRAYRTLIDSSVTGVTRTITCAAVSLTNVDFIDITIAGAAAPATGTSLGDGKGNSGITFTAAKTVYWNLSGGGSIDGTGWATTSSGTPAVANFPLAQDTMIFSSSTTTLASGGTITINKTYVFGTIDMSARTTNTMTLSYATGSWVCGNFTCGSGCTVSGAGQIYFAGRSSQTLTTAGITFATAIYGYTPGGTTTISGNFISSVSGNAVLWVQGNLTMTNGTVTGSVAVFSGNTFTLNGTLNVGTNFSAVSGTITTSGTGTIKFNGSGAQILTGSGSNFSTFTIDNSSTGSLRIGGSNTFGTITNSVSPAIFYFDGGTTTTVTNWNVSGSSGKFVTVTVTSGTTPFTLSDASGTINSSFLILSYSTATGGATWNARSSLDSGNNTGWNITGISNFLFFFQ